MSKPVNLNRYRKEKARAEKKVRAQGNAVKFGRSKTDKLGVKLDQDRQIRDLDGHKIDK